MNYDGFDVNCFTMGSFFNVESVFHKGALHIISTGELSIISSRHVRRRSQRSTRKASQGDGDHEQHLQKKRQRHLVAFCLEMPHRVVRRGYVFQLLWYVYVVSHLDWF